MSILHNILQGNNIEAKKMIEDALMERASNALAERRMKVAADHFCKEREIVFEAKKEVQPNTPTHVAMARTAQKYGFKYDRTERNERGNCHCYSHPDGSCLNVNTSRFGPTWSHTNSGKKGDWQHLGGGESHLDLTDHLMNRYSAQAVDYSDNLRQRVAESAGFPERRLPSAPNPAGRMSINRTYNSPGGDDQHDTQTSAGTHRTGTVNYGKTDKAKAITLDRSRSARVQGALSGAKKNTGMASAHGIKVKHPIDHPDQEIFKGEYPVAKNGVHADLHKTLDSGGWKHTDTTGDGKHAIYSHPKGDQHTHWQFPDQKGRIMVPIAKHAGKVQGGSNPDSGTRTAQSASMRKPEAPSATMVPSRPDNVNKKTHDSLMSNGFRMGKTSTSAGTTNYHHPDHGTITVHHHADVDGTHKGTYNGAHIDNVVKHIDDLKAGKFSAGDKAPNREKKDKPGWGKSGPNDNIPATRGTQAAHAPASVPGGTMGPHRPDPGNTPVSTNTDAPKSGRVAAARPKDPKYIEHEPRGRQALASLIRLAQNK